MLGPMADLSAETLDYGRRATEALLGLDRLFRTEGREDSAEGLAVVSLDREFRHRPRPFADYHEAGQAFETLRRAAASLAEADRRAYYDDLCHSSLAFIQWRRSGLAFTRQIQDFLHVPPEPASEAEIGELRDRIGDCLAGMGFRGPLSEQCAAWEERCRIPAQEVPAVLQELLEEAWTRTEERLLPIPRPRSDGMRVVAVTGAAFNARCDYLSRKIELNVDPVLTRPGLKHLAAHEGCPGHYLQFTLRQTLAESGEAPADVLLSLVNSASSSVFEGIGDSGITMLDWMETDDDRVQSLMNLYRAAIGTEAAWQIHALGWPVEEVAGHLAGRSLIGGEGWVANRVKFIQSPARAVLIWSYWWGERVVTNAWRRVRADQRGDFLRFLHGRMHSNRSIEMFE